MRRGIPISPRGNMVRIIVLIIILPLLTWYAKQGFTNPYSYRSRIILTNINNIPTLMLFKESMKNSRSHIMLPINEKSAQLTAISKDTIYITYGNEIELNIGNSKAGFFSSETARVTAIKGGMFVRTKELNMVIGLSMDISIQEKADILFLNGKSLEEVNLLRKKIAPKLLVWITNKSLVDNSNLPSNIYIWDGKSTISFKNGERGVVDVITE